jgi:hypothetical protein
MVWHAPFMDMDSRTGERDLGGRSLAYDTCKPGRSFAQSELRDGPTYVGMGTLVAARWTLHNGQHSSGSGDEKLAGWGLDW